MSYRLLVVAVVAACNSPTSTGLQVLPGPEIDVHEGTTSKNHFVRFDGAPLDVDDLEITPNEHFRAELVENDDGDVYLHVTPYCSAIPVGSNDSLLESVTISLKNSDAEPVVVSVTIRPNELDACAVQAVGWAGSCAERPPAPGDTITLDTASGSQRICVEVTVPDSLASIDVTFPNAPGFDFLDPATTEPWSGLTPSTEPWHHEIATMGVASKFRGEAGLVVSWTGGGSQKLTLIAGQPGDGLLRIRSVANGVAEYGPKVYRFTSSYYAKPNTVSCVRATPRGTSMSLIARSQFAEIIQAGDLACGVALNTVEILTEKDSAEHEYIDVSLEECTRPSTCTASMTDSQCCALDEAVIRHIEDGVIDVPSRSVTESIPVSGPGGHRACVDLDGDDVPEVMVHDGAGTHLQVATGGVDNLRFGAATSLPSPASMQAFRWNDGTGARPILVGQFPTAPFLRVASKSGWDATEWRPLPAGLGSVEDWIPIAFTRASGATYLAVKQSATVISLVCVSPACRGDATPIDVSAIDGSVSASTRISGIAATDIDGDSDLDLLLSVDNGASVAPKLLTLYAYNLEWLDDEIIGSSGPVAYPAAPTGIPWDRLQFATLPSPANGDIFYILARGTIDQHAIIEVAPCGPNCRVSKGVDTISRPFEIANVGGKLFTATDLGIWELANQTWVQRDPERARAQQELPIPQGVSYGRVMRNCLLSNPSNLALSASILFDVEAGARWTFADVVVDSLPEP